MYIIKKVQKYINHKNKEIVKKQAYRFLTTLNTKFIPKTILKKNSTTNTQKNPVLFSIVIIIA